MDAVVSTDLSVEKQNKTWELYGYISIRNQFNSIKKKDLNDLIMAKINKQKDQTRIDGYYHSNWVEMV